MKEYVEIVWMKRWFSHDSRGVSQMWFCSVCCCRLFCRVIKSASLPEANCFDHMHLNWFDLNWLHYKHSSVLTSVPLTVISAWSHLIWKKRINYSTVYWSWDVLQNRFHNFTCYYVVFILLLSNQRWSLEYSWLPLFNVLQLCPDFWSTHIY